MTLETNEIITATELVEETLNFINTLNSEDENSFLRELGEGGQKAQEAMIPVLELLGTSFEKINKNVLCNAITDFRLLPEIEKKYEVFHR